MSGDKSLLVLDSGIGGMTVVKSIRNLCPALGIRYISDNHFFPYGALESEVLTNRVCKLVEQALSRFAVDAVVIACNTASTIVLDALRKSCPVPVVGVVPPVKTAAEISLSRVIGLLATEGTVRRSYLDRLISDFAADCTVARIHCPDLAPMAEEKVRGMAVNMEQLKRIVAPLRVPELSDMDVVVLGCTHYPILLNHLEADFGPGVVWLDPARPVAKQVRRLLYGGIISETKGRNRQKNEIFFTRAEPDLDSMLPFLSKTGLFVQSTPVIDVW